MMLWSDLRHLKVVAVVDDVVSDLRHLKVVTVVDDVVK